LDRAFPDERPLGPRLRLQWLSLSPRRNGYKDFAKKAPPIPAPSRPEPSAQDGKFEDAYLFTTALEALPAWVIETFAQRWAIEQGFRDDLEGLYHYALDLMPREES
jgi:hypothetical protein